MSRVPHVSPSIPGAVVLLLLTLSVLPVHADDKAEAGLRTLRGRFADSSSDREKLRQDLLKFRRIWAGEPEAVAAGELLGRLPSPLDKLDAATIPALDRFAWQPKELMAVLGEHRGRHGYPVSGVAYSPDGKTVASGGSTVLRLWDASTLRQRHLLGHGGAVTAIHYSRDGKTLVAAGNDGTVRLWDVSGDKPKAGLVLAAGTSALYGLALPPSGRLLATGGTDTMVHVFDLSGDKPQERTPLVGRCEGVRNRFLD